MFFTISILLAALVSAIASFILGALWYSPLLFGNFWLKESGMTTEKMAAAKQKGMKKLYLFNFISTFITAWAVAYIVSNQTFYLADALPLMFICWLGFIAATSFGSVIWEGKSVKYFSINVGYHLVSIVLMTVISYYLV